MSSSERPGFSRRTFLRLASIGAGTALVVPAGFAGAGQRAPLPRDTPRRRVLVVGAGLAGLAAAWELEEAGHEVTILEAKSTPGGRVSTLREPFADGLYAEAGAVAFSTAYTEANRYIDSLGLERADWAAPDLPQLHHLGGRRFAVSPGEPVDWPYDLSAKERELGPVGIAGSYVGEHLPPEIRDPEAWRRAPLTELDAVSLADFLRDHGASEGAIELVRFTQYYGFLPEDTSMLSVGMSDFGMFMAGAPFLLAGGNDRLPVAMASRLSREIEYGVQVEAIRQTETGVVVEAKRGRRPARFEGDRVICTVPATVLRTLELDPALPADQRRAVEEIPYVSATRTYVQVNRGFWFDEGVSGAAPTDLPIGYVWRQPLPDPGAPDRRAILESYVSGEEAERLGALPDDEVVEHTLHHLEALHPKIRDHVEGAVVKAWSRDPWALGHVSWPGPGDVTRYLPLLQKPHGKVHFAGEHTSIYRSTMEGALRSGIRAAREVAS